jgi:hypothetical protein
MSITDPILRVPPILTFFWNVDTPEILSCEILKVVSVTCIPPAASLTPLGT